MKQNNSPWLTQLDHDRKTVTVEGDMSTDVVVVGGGIAGVTTLYFLLKNTDRNVVLLEARRLAHGATGHNAGQVVAEFEKPLQAIAHEHGIRKAVDGLGMVEAAWDLLDEIFNDTGIDIPFREFIGYGGYAEIGQLLFDLETEKIKSSHGLMSFPVLVSRQSGWMSRIPAEYHSLCAEVDASVVAESLGITAPGYHAALPQKKATTNSALLTERLALWCAERFPGRVDIREMSHVHGIELESSRPTVLTDRGSVSCDRVVLCTNGFENFYIHDRNGAEIDVKFHHLVRGAVGYMTAYLSKKELEPMANYFYDSGLMRGIDPFTSDPYFYVTRRKFGGTDEQGYLFAVGGPEVRLEEREIYLKDFDADRHFNEDAVAFAERNFDVSEFDQKFFWHGLMGYTRTGVRMVGPEPLDPRLMYNLGCNGVGILPSIMGAAKISRHVAGETVPETIFDPKR